MVAVSARFVAGWIDILAYVDGDLDPLHMRMHLAAEV